MPVSFCPASHRVESIAFPQNSSKTNNALSILNQTSPPHLLKCKELLQSSFDDANSEFVVGRPNGLVMTLSEAYSNHHAVSIRPDDVWIAILTQFSAFVNANAEKLRSSFVAHEGRKELVVYFNDWPPDFGDLAVKMTGKIHENVVDPVLVDWILPKFSTTKPNDIIVSSVVMMATLKKYFRYVFCETCGIPRVTLEGERRDWVLLVERIEKLKEYGPETTAWHHLLRPVLVRFVRAFDEPDSKRNLDFWQKIAHFQYAGSGSLSFSGWLTAFCAFDADGRFIGDERMLRSPRHNASEIGSQHLVLDGAVFHHIDISSIPPCFADVDVLIKRRGGIQYDSVMVAGMVGTEVCDGNFSSTGRHDLLKAAAGWWIFIKKGEEDPGAWPWYEGGGDDHGWYKAVSIAKQYESESESATAVDLSSTVVNVGLAGWLKKLFCSG
ncbi:hypothetical protein K435DRAFT_964264 [Dendrothele bispora CBS 962.96]|uniref:Uncharacterized protein n=1 Tax=Dendrothele bispora (strain CBS 962.96) TaxID=1314807 RepID=A0A4S8MBU5_DENBC|nr:hypothetical protein K435DRAFT_964264 [Dendrothele bispora CBS 962.96]